MAPDFPNVVEAIAKDDAQRTSFLKACLSKLGLQVNQEQIVVPSLSRLHLSSMQPESPEQVMSALADIVTLEDEEECIIDDNDTFRLERQSTWSLSSLETAIRGSSIQETDLSANADDRILDYNKVIKRLLIHEKHPPAAKETPYFNHDAYFANLKHYQTLESDTRPEYGRHLLYGEVVTSTNTILEKYILCSAF